jgi:hypothetical protein
MCLRVAGRSCGAWIWRPSGGGRCRAASAGSYPGVTSSRSPCRRAFGIALSKAASSARSAQLRCRIKISAVCHASSRWDSRSHVVTRVMRRKTNRRHMTGDHHGRGVGRATLLVRAVDAILGRRSRLWRSW